MPARRLRSRATSSRVNFPSKGLGRLLAAALEGQQALF